MKKLFRTALLIIFICVAQASQSKDIAPAHYSAPLSEADAQKLIARLHEIEAMDFSKMTRKEKRALRREVKDAERAIKQVSGGVYLSVGAIIIIILLLILLL